MIVIALLLLVNVIACLILTKTFNMGSMCLLSAVLIAYFVIEVT